MDQPWPIIDTFGARLLGAANFDAALDLLAEETQALGFDGVDYAWLATARLVHGEWASGPVHTRNFPLRWQRGWARYGRHDAILPLCFRRGLPVDWQAARLALALDGAQRAAFDYLEHGLGFAGGITVPIHLPGDRFAFVSGVSAQRGEAWTALSTRAMAPLMVLAHTFHHVTAAHCPPAASAATPQLTRREIDCLQHAASGCSAPVTARVLNRSVDTVRGHLKRALAKLGAHTTAQAVAIAASSGLIDVASAARQSDPIGVWRARHQAIDDGCIEAHRRAPARGSA